LHAGWQMRLIVSMSAARNEGFRDLRDHFAYGW
jgi:hypothetical protein